MSTMLSNEPSKRIPSVYVLTWRLYFSHIKFRVSKESCSAMAPYSYFFNEIFQVLGLYTLQLPTNKVRKMESGIRGDSVEKLKGLHISSRDDEEQEEDIVVDEDDYVDDDDEEEEEEEREPVTLGFVEKPKNKWSLLRQLFPSKVGGSPVNTWPFPSVYCTCRRILNPNLSGPNSLYSSM